mgnify:CR=1 FL=1
MKNDLIICLILMGLFIATMLLAGQDNGGYPDFIILRKEKQDEQ